MLWVDLTNRLISLLYDVGTENPGSADTCRPAWYRYVNKNKEEGYFIFFFKLGSAQRCHHLGYVFTSLLKCCEYRGWVV